MEYKDLVEAFNRTYCFYRQKYVTMASKYTQTVDHPYGDKAIISHLEGRYAMAVFAGPSVTRFISVDIDTGGKRTVRQVVDAFVELGIPSNKIYVSISGSKGYHVDLFFKRCLYHSKAKNLYDLMMWKTGLDRKKVEYRPTNSQAIKLPLGVHAKTGARCWFVDRDTLDPIEDIEYIKRIQFIDGETVNNVVRKWNKKRWNELYAEMICNDSGHDQSIGRDIEFNEAYYESKTLTECGTRHDTMVRIACDLRHYGANKHQISKALTGFYYRQDPDMIESSEGEVLLDIKDIAQWAEESVPVKKFRPSPNADGKSVIINKEEINGILMAPTSASRRIALLLYAYCKLFGAAHVSYDSIANTTGCSVATVKNSITKLMKLHIINKKSGGCHYNGAVLIRQANTYFIPKNKTYGIPPDESLLADEYTYNGIVKHTTIDDFYYGLLTGMCTMEYLEKFLTKPELKDCNERMMRIAGQSAGDDAGGST